MDVDAVIAELGLEPHPEGGWYRETFRSSSRVHAAQGERSAVTAIWFLLPEGAFSAWHVVKSDEIWHHYSGDPVILHLLDEDGYRTLTLGPLGEGQPQQVVPAGVFQAAESTGTTLCGCTVGPGFEFEDFEMPGQALVERFPAHAEVVERFTRTGT